MACAAHFRETGGLDHLGIIDFEHRGDAVVREIHELLDNAFILRFDIADCMRLTDDLDNVIDRQHANQAVILVDDCSREEVVLLEFARCLFLIRRSAIVHGQ